MSLFGTQQVRILGPLTIAGKPLTCPACKDDGKGGGHTVAAAGEGGLATVTCGSNAAHQFRFDGLTTATAGKIPRKGRFELKLEDGATLVGIAARPGSGKAKPVKGAPPARALAAPATAPALGARSKAGPGLAGVIVAALGTVTATVGTVGQIAGAAGQGARAVGDVAKAGSNAVSLARDGVGIAASNQAASNALLMAEHQAKQDQAQRDHDQVVQAARLADAQNAREHQTLRAAMPTPAAKRRPHKPVPPARAL
ncbi:hypothetical protein [Streptomyces sp. CB03911]|uniref:hypothetical protein n=1 Tax=Streptomyces sp. CB03911 TaxID=1804758 RepID=UPI00093BB39D|nr:hypothetical protein [Streptomyces sp. CB03911]OKI14226.1 hypothetical protein A6A07_13835 [Streptomyces sp. CB03911]